MMPLSPTLTLIPTMAPPTPLALPDSPFHALPTPSRADLVARRALAAAERRAHLPAFVQTFAWQTVRPLLPLRLEGLPTVRVWRARTCRSHYVWLPPEDLSTPEAWQGLDHFDVVLRLFDFAVAAPLGATLFQPLGAAALRPGQPRSGVADGALAALGLADLADRVALARTRARLLSAAGFRSGRPARRVHLSLRAARHPARLARVV
jgi:hypothetical protein